MNWKASLSVELWNVQTWRGVTGWFVWTLREMCGHGEVEGALYFFVNELSALPHTPLSPCPHLPPATVPPLNPPSPPLRYDGERLLSAEELPPGSTLLLVVSTYEGGTPPDAARWFCR